MPSQQNEPLRIKLDPCAPSPCGPNSQCREINNNPSCSCLPNYLGVPPHCRPECSINSECGSQLACINQKCRDPCPGSCGVNTLCHVRSHIPICTCQNDYTGDPFAICNPIQPESKRFYLSTPRIVYQTNCKFYIDDKIPIKDPCNPSPCGPNAHCDNGKCICLPPFNGDPYFGCRPECILHTECSRNLACIKHKCVDPCPGICASNAICEVINHIPNCRCPEGMQGNAFTFCLPAPSKILSLCQV